MKRRGIIIGAIAASLAAILASVAGAATTRAKDTSLTGAGSTLVTPLMAKWQGDFGPKAGVTVTYGSIGSGGGIAAITARTVDFGASDAPLTPDQMTACKSCVQIPWALTATGLAYSIKGVGDHLKLSGQAIVDIYLGKVTKWNDPEIAKSNPGVKLPDTPVTPVYRSDGSGDTFAFTDYLSHVSSEWQSKIGNATQVAFPAGVGGKGNPGVAGVISHTDGAIGYVSDAYILSNHLNKVAVQNKAGLYQLPGIKQISAAAATVTSVPADNHMSIVDPPASAKNAYPISTFTYVIVPTSSPKAKLLKQFILYAISKRGQAFGPALIFAPLPKVVAVAANKTLAKVQAG